MLDADWQRKQTPNAQRPTPNAQYQKQTPNAEHRTLNAEL
jgi:hypothetical protein